MTHQDERISALVEQITGGRPAEALLEIDLLLEQQPENPALLSLKGEALRLTGRLVEAVQVFRQAGEKGAGVRNWLAAGVLLAAMRSTAEALHCLHQANEQAPDSDEVLDALITTYFNANRQQEGIELARQQLRVSSNPRLLSHAALLLQSNDLYGESSEAFKKIVELAPADPAVRGAALVPARFTCEWEWVEALQQKIGDGYAQGNYEASQEYPLTHLTWCPDEARNLGVTQAYVQRMVPAVEPLPLPLAPPRAGRRIRVGYLSCDFRNHATMHLMAGLFEAHDRTRFEVFAYDYSAPDVSPYRQRFVDSCEHLVAVHTLGDQQAAERIAADRLDILFDLKLYTGGGRPGIMAYRPAALQAAYLGYPGSAASRDIDYIVSDRFVTPDSSGAHYPEAFCRLPHSYQCNDRKRSAAEQPAHRAAHGLPDDKVVFGAFNQSYKIDRSSFAVWLRVLHEVPHSVLWLLGQCDEAIANLTRYAQAAGIDPQRLIFAPFAVPQDHLARLQLADAVLDTLVCNGHTTTSDALWASVPVITARGQHFCSRVSESLLNAMELPELVGQDQDDMVRIAKRVGTDAEFRLALRAKVAANRLSTPLFDTLRFTRDFETAIEMMIDQHVPGIKGATIDVPDAGTVQTGAVHADPMQTRAAQAASANEPAQAENRMNPLENLFIGVINLEHRQDRRESSLQELAAVGLPHDEGAFFKAVSRPEYGALGASLSHANLLASFLSTSTAEYALIFEDDFTILEPAEFVGNLKVIISETASWEVFLLSHNFAQPIEGSTLSKCFRVANAQTASAYLVKRSFAPTLIHSFFESAVGLEKFASYPVETRAQLSHFYCLDILWKSLQTQYRFVAPFPAMVKQRASYSDIEKMNVDYQV
jgi:predicted O-linked N-acetylglucosamine transferase (SPINDLY family)/GR25 family glycosyltransferase involved in LPS biosynthesis